VGELPAVRQLELLKGTTRKRASRAPEVAEASGARVFIVAAFVVAALGLVMAGFDEQPTMPDAAVASHSPRTLQAASPSVRVANAIDVSSAAEWDRDFVAWVRKKYRYLLADSGSLEARLLPLLLERENVASLIDPHRRDSDPALLRIEGELRALLPAAGLATFRLLEDSDEEQHHLLEFSGGVSNVKPLTAQQQRAVLEIKLRHRQAYDTTLRQSGFYRAALSTAERDYAHRAVAAALSAYRNDYLQDVRQMLDDEQYVLLSNYESTEFDRELQRLQMAINAK
jgi:hypothetical protein